jgi:hypothetical protein
MAVSKFQNKFRFLLKRKKKVGVDQGIFGKKLGLAAKFFGCWHQNLSRPFGQGNIAYRSCLNCGARKQFNPVTMETHGSFYFPPAFSEQQFK